MKETKLLHFLLGLLQLTSLASALQPSGEVRSIWQGGIKSEGEEEARGRRKKHPHFHSLWLPNPLSVIPHFREKVCSCWKNRKERRYWRIKGSWSSHHPSPPSQKPFNLLHSYARFLVPNVSMATWMPLPTIHSAPSPQSLSPLKGAIPGARREAPWRQDSPFVQLVITMSTTVWPTGIKPNEWNWINENSWTQ